MDDYLRPGIDAIEGLDGAAPRLLVVGEDGSEARRDATALAAALAARAEPVTGPEDADLIVAGSARDGAPGRATLDPADRALLEGAGCPVAVAPRGLAGRGVYELRRIDVGIDGGRGAAAALETAVRLAVANSARLRLVGVAEPDGKARSADPRELARLAGRLRHAAVGLSGIRVEIELREGLAGQIIIDLAQEADLFILGSRAAYGNARRVALGDLAARVLGGSPCPALVAPAP